MVKLRWRVRSHIWLSRFDVNGGNYDGVRRRGSCHRGSGKQEFRWPTSENETSQGNEHLKVGLGGVSGRAVEAAVAR